MRCQKMPSHALQLRQHSDHEINQCGCTSCDHIYIHIWDIINYPYLHQNVLRLQPPNSFNNMSTGWWFGTSQLANIFRGVGIPPTSPLYVPNPFTSILRQDTLCLPCLRSPLKRLCRLVEQRVEGGFSMIKPPVSSNVASRNPREMGGFRKITRNRWK